MRKIELLSPAKDLNCARAAIDCGADAVYIGASSFGARRSAGNNLKDIEELVKYAHLFGVKVYVTMNTLVREEELTTAREMAIDLYTIGVDALIIQDMAFLEMELPPIDIHASTQTFNFTAEKAEFLSRVGFSRVILERALSKDEIKHIAQSVPVEIECFVHGAICVCYSGQCYMSEAVSQRSGNRGDCGQPCRSKYNLIDSEDNVIMRNKHLLSVKDLNLSQHLAEMIDMGVCSFKIEGRLKDETYIKNNVSYYRQLLDRVISSRSDLARSSAGVSRINFTPNPEKSFSRGFTDYYYSNTSNLVSSFSGAKSKGEFIGKVLKVTPSGFIVDRPHDLVNGDGICFDNKGEIIGTNINTFSQYIITPRLMDGISVKTEIYRNYDHKFNSMLISQKITREMELKAKLKLTLNTVDMELTDSEGLMFSIMSYDGEWERAKNDESMLKAIKDGFSKSGDSAFRITEINIEYENLPFLPMSVINSMRRDAFQKLEQKRLAEYKRSELAKRESVLRYPEKELTFKANITNSLSEKFYKAAGVEVMELYPSQQQFIGREVMRTRYCLRREIGECLKTTKNPKHKNLYLENNKNIFELKFNCSECEMSVIYKGRNR